MGYRLEMGAGGEYVQKPRAVARPMTDPARPGVPLNNGFWEVYLPGDGVWSNYHAEDKARKLVEQFNRTGAE